jgi:hypothetical protein
MENDREVNFSRLVPAFFRGGWDSISTPPKVSIVDSFSNHMANRMTEICSQYDILSIVDLECGYTDWLSAFDGSTFYRGIDSDESTVEYDRAHFGEKGQFEKDDVCDVDTEIPNADLYLLGRGIRSLDNHRILEILNDIRSKTFRYLLVVSWHERTTNSDRRGSRIEDDRSKINFELPPFTLRSTTDKWTLRNVTLLLFSKEQLEDDLEIAKKIVQIDGKNTIYVGPYIAQSKPRQSKIPRIIHLIWIGQKQIPEYVFEHEKRWKELLPDNWVVRLWTNGDLIPKLIPERVLDMICRAESGGQKADILRPFVVAKFGGFYFDTDHKPINSIDPLVSTLHWAEAIACHYEDWNPDYLANGMFGAVPNHPWISACCQDILRQPLNTDDVNWRTGPGCFARCLSPDMDVLFVLPKFFYPYHYRAKWLPWDSKTCYTAHSWEHDW